MSSAVANVLMTLSGACIVLLELRSSLSFLANGIRLSLLVESCILFKILAEQLSRNAKSSGSIAFALSRSFKRFCIIDSMDADSNSKRNVLYRVAFSRSALLSFLLNLL